MIVGVEEVGMVWKPADTEDYQHNYEHLGQLKKDNQNDLFIIYLVVIIFLSK